jgi:predicted HAD superfamily hydrolase
MLRNLLDYLIIRNSNYFDESYYLLRYKDVRRADIDPLWHFVRIGWKEGRNPSLRFDINFYITRYPDVRESGMNPLVHYIKYGQFEGRLPIDSQNPSISIQNTKSPLKNYLKKWILITAKWIYTHIPKKYRIKVRNILGVRFNSLLLNLSSSDNWPIAHSSSRYTSFQDNLIDISSVESARDVKGKIAIHLHVYYPDLVKELAGYLHNMPFVYDLFISVPNDQTFTLCRDTFIGLPMCNHVEIQIAPNRGRDIAPLICLFGSKLKKYDYIAHLHTKKSLYNKGATQGWREYLFERLLGSKQQIRQIFSLLQNGRIGIVYPQNYVLLPYWANTWLANREIGNLWCSRLGIKEIPRGYFDYPASSMFWARSSALKPLFETGITFEDFPEERGQTDGTLAHTIERLFVLCVLNQGMRPAIIMDNKYPSWSSWRFDQYITRQQTSIIESLNSNQIKLIGFDIFDTLLIRPLLDPETIKKIVAKRAGGQSGMLYLEYRAKAENQARQLKGQDVDIEEIFKVLEELSGLSKDKIDLLKNLELEIEELLLFPREQVIELYRYALATQKPVIIISDMFLPKSIIEKFLIQHHINGWNQVYVSSEIGLRKDDGKLYEYIFEEWGVSPDQFLMVGDNERSDVQIPCDNGSSFIHCLKPVELARGLPRFNSLISQHESSGDINAEITLGLVVQKNFSHIHFPSSFDWTSFVNVTPFNIGYSVVGPLLVSFSDWLHRQCLINGIKRLYFLSREGKLIKDVYDLWTNNLSTKAQSYYLVVSRRAAGVASIQDFNDILDIAKATYFSNTIENFLRTRYGVSLTKEKWDFIFQKIGWVSETEVRVQDENIDHLMPLLHCVEDEIKAQVLKEKTAFINYLMTNEMMEDTQQAVVDVGYGGSVQGYLNKLLSTKIHGFYLMTDERSNKIASKYNVMIKGCFYERINKLGDLPIMYRYSFEVEKLLSSNDPQLEYYELDAKGSLRGIYRDLESLETMANSTRDEIRRGALQYAIDAAMIRDKVYPAFEPSVWTAKNIIETFLQDRSSSENEFLSKIVLDDYYCGRGLVNY